MHVDTYDTAVLMMANDAGRWAPKTHETADHSMPYVIAIALLDGEVTGDSFKESRLADPLVASLMQKIKVNASADLSALYPQSAPSRVRVRMESGDVLTGEVRYPKGHARNPLSDAELNIKFRRIFKEQGRAAQGEAALQALWAFDKAKDVGGVLSLLRAGDLVSD